MWTLLARNTRTLGIAMLLFSLSCASLSGPDIKIVPNAYSQSISDADIELDRAHCAEIADDVMDEYGPHPPYSDSPFADAAELRGHLNRYAAACMEAKGYEVTRRFGLKDKPFDLPASAVSKARGPRGTAE